MLNTLLEKGDFFASPIKYILVYSFTLIGLNIDIEPMRLFIWLWMFDGASFFLKAMIFRYKNRFAKTMRYAASHLGIIMIPIGMVVLMNILGKEIESSYRYTLVFFSGFIFLNFAGNIISCKTKKEYAFELILDLWLRRISNILKNNEVK